MKKFLSLLALMCLSCVGAWADIPAIFQNGGIITLKNSNTYFAGSKVAATSNEMLGNLFVVEYNNESSAFYLKRLSDGLYIPKYSGEAIETMTSDKNEAETFDATVSNEANKEYRLHPVSYNGTMYLNSNGQGGTPKWAAGTGAWSYWAVATKTLDEAKTLVVKNGLVGGYATSAEPTATTVDELVNWLVTNKIAFDENKYYRVWNTSRSEVAKAAWDLSGNNIAWAEYDSESLTQIWKFKSNGSSSEYKYKIQNLGNPSAYITGNLGGGWFHSYVNEASAGVFAISEAEGLSFTIHTGTDRGQYIFADANNWLDGWTGDNKHLWYLEPVEISEAITTITWKVIDSEHNVIASEVLDNCIEGTEYTTSLAFAYTTLSGIKTVAAGKSNQTIELSYSVDGLPFTPSESFSTATWYKMKSTTYDYYAYYDESLNKIPMAQNVSDDWTNLWAFIGDPVRGFKIVNKSAGEDKCLYIATASNGAAPTMSTTQRTWTLVEGNAEKATVENTIGFASNNVYFNDYANGHVLSFWQDSPSADKGSNWILEEVTEIAEADFGKLLNVINHVNEYNVGAGLNKYTYYVDDVAQTVDDWNYAVSQVRTVYDNKQKLLIDDAISNANGLTAKLRINQPQAGTFLRIRNANTKTYVSCNNNSGNTRVTFDNTVDNSKIFYFDGEHLLSYKTGMYIGQTAADNASPFLVHKTDPANNTSSTVFSFRGSPVNVGTYNVVYAGGRYLYDAGNAGSNAANSSDTKYTFWLEEVTSIPVAIASNGLATFYAPVDMQVPDGTTAYAASLDDAETTITYSPYADNIIPAGHGALLKGTNGTINLVPNTGATEKESALVGHEYTVACSQTEESHGASVIYTLQNSGNFMYYTGTKLSGFKAHLELKEDHRDPSGNSPLRVVFVDDFTTGIEAVESNSSNEIFDLQGRRVNNAQKGLYIVNGRKVIR